MKCRVSLQIFLPALLFCFLCTPCVAVPVDNLYNVVIQVTDNTIETRNQLLPQAFDQMIIRVASSNTVTSHPEMVLAKKNIDKFINNYFYIETPEAYNLNIRFNEQQVNNLLTKIGRKTLGKDRPQTLLWLVFEENGKRNFITHGPQTELAAKIENLSANYGIQILFPLMDLTERLFITEHDVINFNPIPLQQAAERYNSDLMLLGKINNLAGIWHCEWRIVEGDQNVAWNSSSANLDDELDYMMNNLANQMIVKRGQVQAQLASNANGNKTGIALRIKGINSVADYAKIFNYLKKLAITQQVEIGSVNGNQATFIIIATGGKDALIKSLRDDNILVAEFEIDGQELTYRITT